MELICACRISAVFLFLTGTPAAQDDANKAYITAEAAAADPDFAVQGEYVADKLGVQVVALGKGKFRVVIHRGGLPGDGWDGSEREVSEEDTAGVNDLVKDLSLKKKSRFSPTLGAEPPKGAVVLFDGKKETFEAHWKQGSRITDDGLLMEGANSIDTFQDFSLHIEFLLPYMPNARGQQRGNSGIYYQSRYETQMLDSFGLDGKDNETGGIYEIRDPDLNMCLPPLTWQTYDAEFTAARFNDKGEKTKNARITVKLNGVVVHRDVELPRTTRAAPIGTETPDPGPIHLQDHGNPVRYRNIWVLPRDAEQEARRPVVPGFERFFSSLSVPDVTGVRDASVGGRLLLGELNCTACHAAGESLSRWLTPHAAPILTDVGKRVQPAWIAKFLADPHGVKPGTTMPHVLADWPAEERDNAVLALASFLASTGHMTEQRPDRRSVRQGERLFHTIGCVSCHQPRAGDAAPWNTSVPLPALAQKYSIPSLIAFLKDPLAVRPAGRMPSLNLDDRQAQDVAHYLLADAVLSPRTPNMQYALYRGNWDRVPDFDSLQPEERGACAALDLNVASSDREFGIRFDGFLRIEREGEYRFHLGSDDGSLLYIDGKKVADSDGIHPHSVSTGSANLTAGMHPIRVEYQQAYGEWTLTLEYEGPGVPRQDIFPAIVLTADSPGVPDVPSVRDATAMGDVGFVFHPELVATGRELFATVGCANCHEMKVDGRRIESKLAAKPLAELNASDGCLASGRHESAFSGLAAAARRTVPQFDLAPAQRSAIAASLAAPPPDHAPNESDLIAHTLTAFNCYACHARDGIGGPERERNAVFTTAIPEMGDEGRIPPPLDRVGDKLNRDWLRHVLQNGADDRPYLRTRMPKFGLANADRIAEAFTITDGIQAAQTSTLDEPELRTKATGRHLVGDKALGCVKCHNFGRFRATGVQAMNLQTMTRRLREDWFLRYLPDPQQYRPGTRMPTGFPDGRATIQDVYDGDANKQVAAIWTYLKDGDRAGIPDGLVGQMIELKPEQSPIIYRNFIEGLSPRGIAVGYPEHCHLAWDADRMALALLWHGRFLDAAMHWEGRGAGFQRPLGDHVIHWEATSPVAVLASHDSPWPGQPAKERGYQFRGYRLNAKQQPTFLYDTPVLHIADFPEPVPRGAEGVFRRQITLTADRDVEVVYVRAAVGQSIEPQADGWYAVDGTVRVHIAAEASEPFVRDSNGRKELLVPVRLSGGRADVVQQMEW